jgi:hypothetical protein
MLMKPRHAAALALLILASCGPDMTTINTATQRAEASAKRVEVSAAKAESAANQATISANEAVAAANLALDAVRRANDVEARWEATASCSHGISDISGHPYPCKPLSAEDWKWIDSRVKQLNPIWCMSFSNERMVPKDCPNCMFDLAMHTTVGCVFKTKAACEEARDNLVPNFYANAEKNGQRVASLPSMAACFEDKSK